MVRLQHVLKREPVEPERSSKELFAKQKGIDASNAKEAWKQLDKSERKRWREIMKIKRRRYEEDVCSFIRGLDANELAVYQVYHFKQKQSEKEVQKKESSGHESDSNTAASSQ